MALRVVTVALLALAVAGCGGSSGEGEAGGDEGFFVGVVEDSTRLPEQADAQKRVDAVRKAGFDAMRITSIWAPGQSEPSQDELAILRNVATASKRAGIRLFVAVYHEGSRTTPLSDQARDEFAAYTAAIARELPSVRDFIIGNEPNINRFWMPQFGPAGEDVAARDYGRLLARTYDELKAVSEDVNVIGGALAPRGSDRPELPRHTHSPTAFLRDLGAAYRASARDEPLMDMLAFHPYETNSSIPPGDPHPDSTTITLGDYDKLVALLDEAFEGTAQQAGDLPIVYTEFGVESRIPPEKRSLYQGREPPTIKPVSEETQADHYERAVRLAYCQPTVEGILLFHVFDEVRRLGWQSGVRYVDGTAKASFEPVRRIAEQARDGELGDCE